MFHTPLHDYTDGGCSGKRFYECDVFIKLNIGYAFEGEVKWDLNFKQKQRIINFLSNRINSQK